MTKFSRSQLALLRAEYAKIDRIDPLAPTYPKMIALLEKMTPELLQQVANARIKFLSRLAANRVAA